IVNTLFPGAFHSAYPLPIKIVARIMALTPIGLCLGLAIGAGGWTARRVLVGGLGGAIGGLASGASFDIVGTALKPFMLALQGGAATTLPGNIPAVQAEVGMPSRALTFLMLGGLIGLFVGIVDRVVRSAWVRLVLGRNEGREWVIDSANTFIGRSELVQIPLFGDPGVAPNHACIVRRGPGYVIIDAGSPTGIIVNGQRVSEAPLFHGATIQIASHRLVFLTKRGAVPAMGAEALRSQAAFAPGQPGYPAAYAPAAPSTAGPGPMLPAPPGPASSTGYGAPAPSMPTTAIPAQGAPSLTRWVLVALTGPLAGQRFDVPGPIEVGREATGIGLSFDASVSRRHATLSPGPTGLTLTDLGSTNGSYVNDRRTPTANLRPGDIVRFGTTSFRVESA
ncbi:MAG: FHA domain-containing protein, partial [Fimbriimonadaceae bacterium]